MNVEELLCEWENTPGSDLEQKLRAFIERVHANIQDVGGSDEEVNLLRSQIEALKSDNDRLEATVDKLRTEAAQIAPVAIDNSYSLDQFLLAVTIKKGGTYGWKVDYVHASMTTGCQEVTLDDIQKWQKDGRVPDWAYTQIERMAFPERVGRSAPSWKHEEIEYLIELYTANPHESNASLAIKCSERYGSHRSEQSIKGAIYRLGRQGRLPMHRPSK